MATHAVGGWVRYRCEERPSNASRPCSSSYVPSGRPTCACLVTRPFCSGNIAPPFYDAFLAFARSSACRLSRSCFLRLRSLDQRIFARSPLPIDLQLLVFLALREL